MGLIERIFRRSSDSAAIAKQRLLLVLTQDRTNISPETLNVLKDEMISVISRYVEIDGEHVEVSLARTGMGMRLTANIPVLGVRGERPPSHVRHGPPTRVTPRKAR